MSLPADNRGSLSKYKRPALAVIELQGTSSRQIYGGLRVGAGCLPSSGVWGSRKAPAGYLYTGESAPTRFRLSKKPCGNPAVAGMAGLFSLYQVQERAIMPKHSVVSTPSVSTSLDAVQAKLEQTNAVLSMLLNDAGESRFDSDHGTVLAVLWTALDLVNAAREASQQVFDAYIAEVMTMAPTAKGAYLGGAEQ